MTETENATHRARRRPKIRFYWITCIPGPALHRGRHPLKENKDVILLATRTDERNISRRARIWKVRKVNLDEREKSEDNSILSFNPIPLSPEYADTPVVDVPHSILFTQPSPIPRFSSRPPSIFLRLFCVTSLVCSSSFESPVFTETSAFG